MEGPRADEAGPSLDQALIRVKTMPERQATVYAILDVERIQDFIFETGRLRDIRGASALLIEIEQKLDGLIKASGGNRIYVSGGIALASFPCEEKAKQFIDAAKEEYRLRSQGAVSVAAAWGPRTGSSLPDYHELHRRLRLAKEERREEGSTPGPYMSSCAVHLPHCKLCTRCGLRPAVEILRESDEILCAPCQIKTTLGTTTGKDGLPVEQELQGFLRQKWQYKDRIEVPKEFGDFGKEEWRSRRIRESSFMALLLADGNGMGVYIEQLIQRWSSDGKTQDAIDEGLRTFSQALEETLKGAWSEAVYGVYGDPVSQKWLRPNGQLHLPLRILLCGGDDLLAVVEAGRAMELAREFVRAFEGKAEGAREKLGCEAGDPLTISVAVILGKVNYPFAYFYDLAHMRLRTAKGWGRLAGGPSRRPPARIHLGVIRSSAPEVEQEGEKALDLPAIRPFSCEELDRLIQGLTWVAGGKFPRSKLKDLAGVLQLESQAQIASQSPPILTYNLWRAHLRKEEREGFDGMVKALAATASAYPWIQRNAGPDPTRWVTPLADLLELMDFWGE